VRICLKWAERIDLGLLFPFSFNQRPLRVLFQWRHLLALNIAPDFGLDYRFGWLGFHGSKLLINLWYSNFGLLDRLLGLLRIWLDSLHSRHKLILGFDHRFGWVLLIRSNSFELFYLLCPLFQDGLGGFGLDWTDCCFLANFFGGLFNYCLAGLCFDRINYSLSALRFACPCNFRLRWLSFQRVNDSMNVLGFLGGEKRGPSWFHCNWLGNMLNFLWASSFPHNCSVRFMFQRIYHHIYFFTVGLLACNEGSSNGWQLLWLNNIVHELLSLYYFKLSCFRSCNLPIPRFFSCIALVCSWIETSDFGTAFGA